MKDHKNKKETTNNNPIEWLKRMTHNDSINKISHLSGIPYTTLYKRFQARTLTTDEIIAIARGYALNPVEALVQNGVIDKEEATAVRGDNALRLCNINDIAREIVRRDAAATGPAVTDSTKPETHEDNTKDSTI